MDSTLVAVGRAAVAVRNVTKVYGNKTTAVTALNDVSVAFDAARLTAIMGPSGSGKSTLMHCAAGLDTVTSGSVSIGGREITTLSDTELTRLRRTSVGFIFQAFNLLPTLTAEQNMLLPLELAGRRPDPRWYSTIVNALDLTSRLNHTPSQLSGGQQQRVACGRALLPRPAVIFADEPTGNLDSRSGADVLRFMRRCVDEFQQTIVMVTHDPVAASYADRVVMLIDGSIADEIHQPTHATILDALRGLGV
jgi:putative ABC transport system ATP-binding protein